MLVTMIVVMVIVAVVVAGIYQLKKINKKSEDEKYIHGLLKEYSGDDVADMVRLTQGLRDVQKNIEDKDKTITINMASLSNLWKDLDNSKAAVVHQDGKIFWNNLLSENSIKTEKPYKHQTLNEFLNEIKKIVIDMPNRVSDDNIFELIKYDVLTIIWLLALLDKKGDCPSVANITNNGDNDTHYKNDYAILSKYTLLDHSIRVAHQAMALLEKDDTGCFILLPVIVAALGHDIGKIPDFLNEERYANYQHQAISVAILRRSKFFSLISDDARREFIDKAIAEHHSKDKTNNSIKNPILVKLIEADRLARQEELTDFDDILLDFDNFDLLKETKKPIQNQYIDSKKNILINDIPSVDKKFLAEFVQLIKAKINVVKKDHDKCRFNAFVYNNNYVYVTVYLITNVLIDLFNKFNDQKTADIMLADHDSKDKSYTTAIIYYVLDSLIANIATDFFAPGHLVGYFDIYAQNGNILHNKAYFTVFKIDMFVEPGDTVESTIQELEKRKRIDDNTYLQQFYNIKPV